MKKTIIILAIILVAVISGYVYDQVSTEIEKKAHPIMYEDIIDKYSAEYAVPKEIILSIINTESSFRSDIVSNKGAVGLMQLTPDTFEWLTTKTGEILSQGLLYEPETNIKYGTFFLRYLFEEFEKWDLAFLAYNAGLSRVKNEWMKNPEYIKDKQIVYIPIDETRNYLQKVNKNITTYRKLYFKEK